MRLSHVCSVAEPDDVAAVRVLRTALDRHHPGVPLTVAALPGAYFELEAIGGVDPVPISDLATDLPVRVVDLPVAVAAAVGGPLLLEHGLRDDASAVALIAPDCDVRGRLIAIEAALDRSDVVALARIDGRLPDDGERPDASDLLAAGEVDDAVVAVRAGAGAARCVDWWLEGLLAAIGRAGPGACRPPSPLGVAARALSGVEIVADPGYGLSAWNLHERPLTDDGEGRIRAAGQPVELVRFTGFRPDRPWWLSDGASRVRVIDDPCLAWLCRERAAALRDAGWSPPERRGVADDLGPLQRDPRVQRMVRDAIAAGARCGVLAEPGGEPHLLRWLAGPAPVGMAVGVNRYSYDLWCLRPDVQAAFPDLDGEDGARFAVWLWDHGRDEAQLDERLLPPRPAAG